MKKFMLTSVLALAAAFLSAAEAKQAADGSWNLSAGARTLNLSPCGRMICKDNAGKVLFDARYYFWGKDLKTGKIDWSWITKYLDKKKSTLKKDGNKFVWQLFYTVNGKTFSSGEQSLEMLGGSKFRYCGKVDLPKKFEGFEMLRDALLIALPQDSWNGGKMDFAGKSAKFDISSNYKAAFHWKVKNQTAALLPAGADSKISFSGTRGNKYDGMSFSTYKVLKNFRITAYPNRKSLVCQLDIDLNAGK